MIENLLNLIRENAGESIINNPDIPNERNDEAIQATGASILSGLQGMMAQGNVKEVLGIFAQGQVDQNNPVVQNLSGNVISDMMGRFGMDQGKAGSLVGSLLPMILNQLISRTNDPSNNGFSLDGLFGQLSGGRTSGMNLEGLVGKLAGGGLDRDGDGDVDFQDLAGMFTGGGNAGGNSGGMAGGNALDALKGIFGR
ncbi:DUF937 domain-containing protein [Flavihumibacter sp. RY-1]|uniref:DUF937 domain-containing protein n=1 Tax=Flavihumibacter fluminis TaxID=2909236 RepID=A0ABS9BHD4_9BACT|nr:DUF937 domain-containing protein [Flavihumibacter fluminis]MCF1715122.1 DUF937 domain-containing protein [Flavihumibacter fluminis]